MSLIASSQTQESLKPIKVTYKEDTLRCFTDHQSKYIVKRLVYSTYCDTIAEQYENTISAQDSTISSQKSAIKIMRSIDTNNQIQLKDCNTLKINLISDLNKSQQRILKLKRNRWFFLAGGIIIGLIPTVL